MKDLPSTLPKFARREKSPMTLHIRKAHFSDFFIAYGWCKNKEEIQDWAGNQIHASMTKKELQSYWKRRILDAQDTKPLVLQTESNTIIGYVELSQISYIHKSARIEKFIIGPDSMRRQGYGAKFMKALKTHVFDVLRLHRLDLLVIERNVRSERLYQRAGFEVEGVMRDARRYDGFFFDMKIMSSLARTENEG